MHSPSLSFELGKDSISTPILANWPQPPLPTKPRWWISPRWVFWIWLSSSYLQTLFNWFITDHLQFRHGPIIITWHWILTMIVTLILSRTTKIVHPPEKQFKMTIGRYLLQVFPIGFLYTFNFLLGPVLAIPLGSSTIQVTKALTPMLVLIIGLVIPRSTRATSSKIPPRYLLPLTLVICIGSAITGFGKFKYKRYAFFAQVSSIIFDALLLQMKEILVHPFYCNLSSITALYYMAPIISLFMTGLYAKSELLSFRASDFSPVICVSLALNSLTSIFSNWITLELIKQTSSYTYSLSLIPRNALFSITSNIIYRESVLFVKVFGYLISFITYMYTLLLSQQYSDNKPILSRVFSSYQNSPFNRNRMVQFIFASSLLVLFIMSIFTMVKTFPGQNYPMHFFWDN